MHALVLMAPRRNTRADAELQAEHERFIDGLDQADKVVLGRGLRPAAAGFEGAYVVTCESLEEACETSASDPLVRAQAIRCQVVEWELVGVNPMRSIAVRCSSELGRGSQTGDRHRRDRRASGRGGLVSSSRSHHPRAIASEIRSRVAARSWRKGCHSGGISASSRASCPRVRKRRSSNT